MTNVVADLGGLSPELFSSRPVVTLLDHRAPTLQDRESNDRRDDRWVDLLLSRPSPQLVRNVETRWGVLQAGSARLPVTINDAEYDNSYVCSPYTAYATYPRLEVDNIPGRILPAALRVLLHSAGPVLRAAQINRVVCVNNWLLSTNLYAAISPEFVPEVTRQLAGQFPSHAIVFRSLNYVTNRELCERLAHSGYLLAPSRQIFLIDGRTNVYLRKQNARWDRKLLESTKYRVVPHESLQTSDAVRIEQMYRSLYVEKYSQHNPQPSVEMIEELLRRRLLSMRGLRTECGRLDGIVGTLEREGVMSIPLLGYDRSLPIKLGLYRMLMALAMQEAAERGLLLNLSSGAADFKRVRGGEPCLEYTAIYCRHLSWPRRAVWLALALAMQQIGSRIFQKYDL